jgi:hypothetical protein
MKSTNAIRTACPGILVALLLAATAAGAATDKSDGIEPPSSSGTSSGAALYWYDGDTRRTLQVDAQHVARLGPTAKSARPADVIVPAGLVAKEDAAAVSPLLRDASGVPRALPGGVIVTLPADPGADQARARLRALGVEPVRPIGAGARVWLVASEPGLASLHLANRLHETGSVSAQPNWWQPRVPK